jgi:hypothetical protein
MKYPNALDYNFIQNYRQDECSGGHGRIIVHNPYDPPQLRVNPVSLRKLKTLNMFDDNRLFQNWIKFTENYEIFSKPQAHTSHDNAKDNNN